MKNLRVRLKERSYQIIIGQGVSNLLGQFIKKLYIGDCAHIITDRKIRGTYGSLIKKSLERFGFSVDFSFINADEEGKTFQTAHFLVRSIIKLYKKKSVFLIALGGGVAGDVTGFVASIVKRGIPYIQVPSTLLAQVDSAIGGKTAVDVKEAKNMVGSFYQPKLVICETNFLKSLDKRQLRNGIAEIIKYGVIKDSHFFGYLEDNIEQLFSLTPGTLTHVISTCCAIKSRVVELDERDNKGIRAILNFGHTMGHAIEAASRFKYTHGEAVALGMLLACDISRLLGLAGQKPCQRIENLITRAGLPVKIKGVSPQRIIQSHYYDKKFSGARNRFVLLKDLGRTVIVKDVPLEAIKKSLQKRS